MPDRPNPNPPSPFVRQWLSTVAPGARAPRALDLACGSGRHALAMARAGYAATAVDIRLDALRTLRASADVEQLAVQAVCADMTAMPLPQERFDLIVVTRYLDRTLFPALREALRPGGILLVETFTEHQLRHGSGPRSSAHLLRPGELRTLVTEMDVLFDEEVMAPSALARMAARKRESLRPSV